MNIKGLAGSIATLANWFVSWLVTMTANMLLAWSSGGTFTLYALVCGFTVAFVSLWVPETKGKTLEEIQALFRWFKRRRRRRQHSFFTFCFLWSLQSILLSLSMTFICALFSVFLWTFDCIMCLCCKAFHFVCVIFRISNIFILIMYKSWV